MVDYIVLQENSLYPGAFHKGQFIGTAECFALRNSILRWRYWLGMRAEAESKILCPQTGVLAFKFADRPIVNSWMRGDPWFWVTCGVVVEIEVQAGCHGLCARSTSESRLTIVCRWNSKQRANIAMIRRINRRHILHISSYHESNIWVSSCQTHRFVVNLSSISRVLRRLIVVHHGSDG
jgi:hypothetical protein